MTILEEIDKAIGQLFATNMSVWTEQQTEVSGKGMVDTNLLDIGLAGGAFSAAKGVTAAGRGAVASTNPIYEGVMGGKAGGGWAQGWPLKMLVIWNLATDWVWIQNMLREIIGLESAPEKLKGEDIGIGEELQGIGNAIIYAETPQEWTFIQQRMDALQPMLNEFSKYAGEANIPEYTNKLNQFQMKIEQYKTQIAQATGVQPTATTIPTGLKPAATIPWTESRNEAFKQWLVRSGKAGDMIRANQIAQSPELRNQYWQYFAQSGLADIEGERVQREHEEQWMAGYTKPQKPQKPTFKPTGTEVSTKTGVVTEVPKPPKKKKPPLEEVLGLGKPYGQ